MNHTVTTSEIRIAWAAIQRGECPVSKTHAKVLTSRHLDLWRSSEPMSWTGCSGAQINDRLQHGYAIEGDAPDLTIGSADYTTPMVELVEEDGDLLVDAALNGDDLFMARWEDYESKRGLTIRADIGFSASVDASMMATYTGWLLRILDTAERQGFAPDLELMIQTRSPYTNDPQNPVSGPVEVIVIPLVKAGEIVDTVAWRAFLSPGAFRTLGFLAKGIVASRVKRTLTQGMGWPVSKGWTATLSDDVLTITANGQSDHFPEDQMTTAVDSALSI